MTTMAAAPPHNLPQAAYGIDYSAVRSPEYATMDGETSKNTTSHISHVSPRQRSELANRYNASQYHQQLRPMKGPMYVPAVLRPTEKPARQSPPRNDTHNSRPGDDSWSAIVGAEQLSASPPSSSGITTRTGVTDLTNDELTDGPVTGLPSTNHWKPDASVLSCNARGCNATFGLFVRRHHCRRCGNIFCWQHSSNQAPLNQHALFHAGGTLSRVCDRCHRCYDEWHTRRTSRTNSESSGSSGTQPMHIRIDSVSSVPGSVAFDRNGEAAPGTEEGARPETFKPKSFVTSIPNHWNWSTF